MSRHVVLGVDLSLRGLGLCAVPSDWDLDWSRLRTERFGAPLHRNATESERIERNATLASMVHRFADQVHATLAAIEGYPLSGRVHGLAGLCELGGVVRVRLHADGMPICTAPIASARKLLLGKLPRSDQKLITHETVRSMGAPASWSGDEIDAWIAANWGCAELGLCAIAAPAEVA